MWRRALVAFLRSAEAAVRLLGGMPRKSARFNRLIEEDVARSVAAIGKAETIVGIPFYREVDNLRPLVEKTCRDLEAQGQPAAIVIVGERKARGLLSAARLPLSTGAVKLVVFCKPFGFGQKPGLSRRSWSHWAILRIASRLSADVIFIDADVRNSEGWIGRYLEAIRERGASIAVANYVRDFARDDAIVHVWDRLIFGALFRRWIAFRHGGDYAIARSVIPQILADASIMRERTYSMDSTVMAKVAQSGGRIEAVWLGKKIHEPVTPQNLFQRLPDLVQSVFDDVVNHLPVLLALRKRVARLEACVSSEERMPMQELVGADFRHELHADLMNRFKRDAGEIRRAVRGAAFERYSRAVGAQQAGEVALAPGEWAKATVTFLARYITALDQPRKLRLVEAYVPILELGVLSFLNRTYALRYDEAFDMLTQEYLPAFERAWNSLARRRTISRIAQWRRWPGGLRNLTAGMSGQQPARH